MPRVARKHCFAVPLILRVGRDVIFWRGIRAFDVAVHIGRFLIMRSLPSRWNPRSTGARELRSPMCEFFGEGAGGRGRIR